MNFVGLDIGGANIKLASTDGDKREITFAFWKHKDKLAETLAQLRDSIGPNDLLGITMTAELADCFESKQAGVTFIVESVLDSLKVNKPLFYKTDGTMCDAANAFKNWRLLAASNWHALASLAFKDAKPNSGFVFDIGSTTTDIIPVHNGSPVIDCQDDLMRLKNGQLYYGGIGRTPICGLMNQVELDGEHVGIAREFFATTNDALIVLDETLPDGNCFDTADGRSRSKDNARKRLARMVCADAHDIGDDAVFQIATQARMNLVNGITQSLLKVIGTHSELPLNFATFGGGAWLAEKILAEQGSHFTTPPTIRSFSKDELTNQTAPAFAVAMKRKEFHEIYSV